MSEESPSLYPLMTDVFGDDDLRDLCFDLQYDYEDLPPVGKSGKIRELILVFEKNGRIPDLIAACKTARPEEEWPDSSRPQSIDVLLGEPLAPLKTYEPETLPIPAGEFLMGSDADETTSPQHEVDLPTFYMSKYPITNEQYAEFVRKTNHDAPSPSTGWSLRKPPKDKLDHPVVTISWADALAYCQWLSADTGKTYRLPTEAEWEKASRGTDGRIYPWGNDWNEAACNNKGEGTTPVTQHDDFASPFGCVDMIGNVQEWVSTMWGEDRKVPEYAYPYDAHDGREDLADDPGRPYLRRIFRGGSFKDKQEKCTCTERGRIKPSSSNEARGFRVVWER